jgi:hypothetical protein
MSDAKFRWYEAMYHDDQIPITLRGILGYCGIRYAKESDGFVIKVRQQTIAENLAVDVKTVKRAFAAGRNRGWLRKSHEGQRGRSHHEPDTHVLTRPQEMGDSNGTHSQKWGTQTDEMGDSNGTHYAEIGDLNPRNGGLQSPKTRAPTSENETLQGLDTGFNNYQGFPQGFAREEHGPDYSELFGGLFGNGSSEQRNGEQQRALPAANKPDTIDAVEVEIEPEPTEPYRSHLDMFGDRFFDNTEDTTRINPEDHRTLEIRKLRAFKAGVA